MNIDTVRHPLLSQGAPDTARARPDATGSDCGLRHMIRSCKAAVRRAVASRPACIDMLPRILLCCIPSAKGSEARAQMGVWRVKRDEQAQFDSAVQMTLAKADSRGRDNTAEVLQKWISAGVAADKTKAVLRGLSESEQPESPQEPAAPIGALSKWHFGQLVDLSGRLNGLLASTRRTGEETLSPEAVDFLCATLRGINAECAHRRGAFDDLAKEHDARNGGLVPSGGAGPLRGIDIASEARPEVQERLSRFVAQTVTLSKERGAQGESIGNYLHGLTKDAGLYEVCTLARAYTRAVAAVGVTEMSKNDRTTAQAIAKQLKDIARQKVVDATSADYHKALGQGYAAEYASSVALSGLYGHAMNITGVLGPETTKLALHMHAAVLGHA